MAPNTAESLPQITDGGRTYTIKVKRGIYFATDPAFTGKKRELTAEDYEQAHALSDGGERNALFRKMTDLIVGYAPWIMSTYPYYNVVAQPWLKGFKFNPFKTHQWQNYDVDGVARP